MARLLTLASGRRAKWLVLAAWLGFVFAAFAAQLPAKYADAEENESTSFLPGDAESTRALVEIERVQDGEQAPVVIVYRREGGLTRADRARIAQDRRELNDAISRDRRTYRTTSPFGEPIPGARGDA